MEDGKFAKHAPAPASLHIGGVSVKFPVKPYPSQLSMMSMIIRGLDKQQHCLLESPTGSGKSLALLCSALAWQRAQRNKAEAEMYENLKSDVEKPPADVQCTCEKATSEKTEPSTSKYFGGNGANNDTAIIDLCTPEEDDDDFKKPVKSETDKVKVKKSESCAACNPSLQDEKSIETEEPKKIRVPKIWFGTRTHKQIAQITKELGRTSYDNVKMTILSSRQHSCIHPDVMKSANKNEECRDLRRGTHASGGTCSFYHNVHRMKSHRQISCAGLNAAWDLEELVGLGKTIKACPFYSARELVASSDIVFCPYNYLVDPLIRSQMQINLNNQIVILDEAHNIEDSAREAGSFTMTEDALANTTSDLEYLISDGVKVDDHRPLHLLCMRLGQWIGQHTRNLADSDYETSSGVWYGRSIISHLEEWGITQATLPLLVQNFSSAADLGDEDIETAKILHSSSQATLGGLFNVLRYLMDDDYKYCDDYRVTIVRQAVFGPMPPKRTREGWVTIQKRSRKHFVTNLHFWCLNPAVAFSDFSKAHCIILTSGTLSPMSSFSSELGVEFPIQLEANHVIHDSQVWVGSIGKGPNGTKLEATYKNIDKMNFQDDLGELVSQVCRVVPYGVLCFFSSYSTMQKLQNRWKATGLWRKIEEVKEIVCEPRSSSKDEFDDLLKSFYTAIEEAESTSSITGALLFAVCRGKVSEGLDFADNNARAVITVGIPFPSIKDKQVELKRKYNDMHKNQRGLLSGAQWYEIQAYRAINQALGRCIRHRTDWGALIVVDDRFCQNPQKYVKGLSKWIRQKMTPYTTYAQGYNNLRSFVQGRGNGDLEISTINAVPHTNQEVSHLMIDGVSLPPKVEEVKDSTSDIHHKPSKIRTKDIKPSPNVKSERSALGNSIGEFFKRRSLPGSSTTANSEPEKCGNKPKSHSPVMENKSIVDDKAKNPEISVSIRPENSPDKLKSHSVILENKSLVNGTPKGPLTTLEEIDDLSPDEDFQFTMTRKQSTEKKRKPGRNQSRNSSTNKSYSQSASVEEDFFECTIPVTPEKCEITIIPESPDSVKKEPSFLQNRSVRQNLIFTANEKSSSKRKFDQDHNQPSTPSSKRKTLFEAQNANIEDSCELLPRARRMVKGLDKKEDSEKVTKGLKCNTCGNLLHSTSKTLNKESLSSNFLNLIFKNYAIYSLGADDIIEGSVTSLSAGPTDSNPVNLNAHWCNDERRCYMLYKCSNCATMLAARVVSEIAGDILFSSQLTSHD